LGNESLVCPDHVFSSCCCRQCVVWHTRYNVNVYYCLICYPTLKLSFQECRHTCIVLPISVIPKYFSCYHFFSLCYAIIDLIFGMWVYNDKLQIKFTFRSGPVIFWPSCDPWTLKFGQIFSYHSEIKR
jgi:hypothetical protein